MGYRYMTTTFDRLRIGDKFKCGILTFVKTYEAYPARTPLHKVAPNCVCIENNHKCVMGKNVEVDYIFGG